MDNNKPMAMPREWGPRERLEAWLMACRNERRLGFQEPIDFELVKEAFTEIERLHLKDQDNIELGEILAERDKKIEQLTVELTHKKRMCTACADELADSEAEVSRLRAALEDLLRWGIDEPRTGFTLNRDRAISYAREALSTNDKAPTSGERSRP